MKSNILSLSSNELSVYVEKQLNFFFPDSKLHKNDFKNLIDSALERSLFCFSKINQKHFSNSEQVFFNHLNGDQYSMFLYFLSNEAYIKNFDILYTKSSNLNKVMHGIDLFGHIKMPEVFLLVHPIGTIIGRALFKERLVIYQGVTIGGKHRPDGSIDYPVFSENTVIYSNSTIIGKTILPENTVIGSGTFLSDFSLDMPNKLIVGCYPNNLVKNSFFSSSFFF